MDMDVFFFFFLVTEEGGCWWEKIIYISFTRTHTHTQFKVNCTKLIVLVVYKFILVRLYVSFVVVFFVNVFFIVVVCFVIVIN